MRTFFIISLAFLSLIHTSCSNGDDDSESDSIIRDSALLDSLAQIIQPEEMTRGKLIYRNLCQTCHQEDGSGVEGAFPSIAVNESDAGKVVNGVEGSSMIAFKDELTDREIADVLNYINNTWGKKFGRTTIEEIRKLK
jgi:mono/diheme cytochrome c family protein